MVLGIPRGFFYYEYFQFIKTLLKETEVSLLIGDENSERILALGNMVSVDEACFPVKLFAGQVESLRNRCDFILIPRVMKDCRGRWLCPKLLGLPELTGAGLEPGYDEEGLLVTEPLYFHDKKRLKKALWHICKKLKVGRKAFEENFAQAYQMQCEIAFGLRTCHVEAAWEFNPPQPPWGEIILPNAAKVLLTGHCYNVYDKFANGDIMKKLDDLGIEAITEKSVNPEEREQIIADLHLMKQPFWESFIRILGTAMCLKQEVEGVIYLSSFSCGLDAFIVEMLKTYLIEIPIMVLKLDEHRGEAGFETRIEAFADLLEKRRAS